MKQKITNFITSLNATINVEAENQNTIKLQIPNAVLETFLVTSDKESIKEDADKVEEFILLQPAFKFTYTDIDNTVKSFACV